ncbi:hypothetical protein SAMN04487867_104109 [Vreelandella titanicae]|uniref:hypothetical protein n=1 Tax=Vreelandella titanicae TaxID=664683 RepID=UPI000887142D|nr:hypothetical protein [Halomonas titanicae]SDI28805.1 hypothetical protein SAMN04487867_104109 [Halomonas titanicae]
MIPIHHGTPAAVDARVREEFVEHLCLVNEDFNHEKRALLEENDALAAENVALRKEADLYRAAEEMQIALREKMERQRDALAAHVDNVHNSINDLIRESQGVAGLHKNGDVAEWESLLEGGHFEGWLLCLSEKPDTACLEQRDARLIRGLTGNLTGSRPWVKRTAIWLERQAKKAEGGA